MAKDIEESLRLIEDLKFFLLTAPANWQKNQIIRRYYLSHEEGFVSCVFWNNLYFITGTDIVRCAVYRFEQFGREIVDRKKFEEGIFSDLRNLKCGSNAILENSRSPFLSFLYKNSCLRTQKKQKVFFWFSVPHDKIFADALERDLKKEKQNQVGTTKAVREPAKSFKYDDTESLYDQLLDYIEKQNNQYLNDKLDSSNVDLTGSIKSQLQSQTQSQSQSQPQSQIQPLQQLPQPDMNEITLNSIIDDDLEPQTFYIKEDEKSQKPFVQKKSPGDNLDDFPLDYFPSEDNGSNQQQQGQQTEINIDPSTFFNPPDYYNDELLIDQTYNKTPYYQTTFDEDPSQSQSMFQQGGHFQYIPPTASNPYPISNAQFYDNTIYPQQMFQQIHPQAFAAYPPPPVYYYEQPIPFQAPMGYYQNLPAETDDVIDFKNEEDEADFYEDTFQQPPPFVPTGFPSNQAFKPPNSAKYSNRNRISKPVRRAGYGNGSQSASNKVKFQKLAANQQLATGTSRKSAQSQGDEDEGDDKVDGEEEDEDQLEDPKQQQGIDGTAEAGADEDQGEAQEDTDKTVKEESEYYSLPTPESTENWTQRHRQLQQNTQQDLDSLVQNEYE